ncbi:MAG: hypothetical protein HXX12_13550 [Geothrix sp.]|uniref:hypothetical protein n=1 Tax=Geothrix sp. TaxID=1962974 RepID=UPI00182C4BF5|nr:hypothetical protein [Geothrix sp.]NWJ41982.1 hypothetical protein [Geothrix sp.]WIL20046.1 MAG: hypothetical protein QOZ81_002589 [Geothrix sp.]
MTRTLCTLVALFALGGPARSAHASFDAIKPPTGRTSAVQDSRPQFTWFPAVFQRELGVSWDGRIGWKTSDRVWVFAVALEQSLGKVIRPDSPFRLNVTVLRAEKGTGTFVVEFAILDPSGESVEAVQVEGVGPRGRLADEVYPALAGEIVGTFKKSVLQVPGEPPGQP